MAADKFLEVIELRNYLLKPNVRDKFSAYFAEHFVHSQNVLGGLVLGQFTLSENPDNFFWVRGFENMQTRSLFLPEFYYGETWKKFGGEANEMMIDSDNVYLLKPLNGEQIFRKSNIMKIDFYFAADGKLTELTDFVATEINELSQFSLWQSELSKNDFPKLPAFQYENLLVVIAGFENDSDYSANLKKFDLNPDESKNGLKQLVVKKESLIISAA